ncbi:hypothetical protein AJ80_03928 [Polytolypa hystricis UAMH7299]|uniref:Oxo-4-hydroxy-4-carboxy-5-ureidoimidazoline decarboxylase domain-containing protein n=1 Tax=Polytolypa hystricis (strain UAMH7299) TaxID=1447883 RepID=A0A2B7YEV3_POLH7|nr:hypothetical protein AJ80_03928 [Polytolypa hystricis UAMH7299]
MASSLPPITTVPTLPAPSQTAILDALFEPSSDLHALILPLLSTTTTTTTTTTPSQQEPNQQQSQPAIPFSSYTSFITAVRARLSALSPQNSSIDKRILYNILGAHPRLGEKQAANLSAASRAEQENLRKGEEQRSSSGAGGEGGNGDGDVEMQKKAAVDELTELRRLNAVYEERFPGLRYVVFVNGRGRNAIIADIRHRIERGDTDLETEEIINAMCDIAIDRARKLGAQVD